MSGLKRVAAISALAAMGMQMGDMRFGRPKVFSGLMPPNTRGVPNGVVTLPPRKRDGFRHPLPPKFMRQRHRLLRGFQAETKVALRTYKTLAREQ